MLLEFGYPSVSIVKVHTISCVTIQVKKIDLDPKRTLNPVRSPITVSRSLSDSKVVSHVGMSYSTAWHYTGLQTVCVTVEGVKGMHTVTVIFDEKRAKPE